MATQQKQFKSPEEFRLLRRKQEYTDKIPSESFRGFIIANVAIVPKKNAFEFLLYCLRNPKPCLPMEVTEAGNPEPVLSAPGSDIRTDMGKYNVWKNGELIETPPDIKKYWRDDLVTFLIGASPSWHYILDDAEIKYSFYGGYLTNVQTTKVGPFAGPIIMSGRVFSDAANAIRAIQLSSRYPVCHGTPVHVGNPADIGVDLTKPFYVTPEKAHLKPVLPGQVAVFWPAGPTVSSAAQAAKLDLMITHIPGWNLITDMRLESSSYKVLGTD